MNEHVEANIGLPDNELPNIISLRIGANI